MVRAEVDSQLGSRKSDAAGVPITHQLLAPMSMASKPDERLAAGAGALPLSSLQRSPGLGERVPERTEECLSASFGPKESVSFKNKKEISSYSEQE